MNDDEQTLTKASPFAFLVTPLSLPNKAELSSWGAAHLDNGPKLGQIAPDSLDALKPQWANGVQSNNSVGLISAQGAQFNILLRMTMLTCAVRLNKNDSSVLAVFPGFWNVYSRRLWA